MYKNQSQKMQYWLLLSIGQLQDDVQVAIACEDKCDGYNIDGGCQRWNQPMCRHHRDTLVLNRGHFVSEYDSSCYISDANLGFSDCEATCWDNCSCVAFNNLFENSTGRKFWTNISKFVANDWPYSELVYILSPIKPSHSGKFTSFFLCYEHYTCFQFGQHIYHGRVITCILRKEEQTKSLKKIYGNNFEEEPLPK